MKKKVLLTLFAAMVTLQMVAQSEKNDKKVIKKVITLDPESKTKDRHNEGTSSHPSREPVEGNTPKRNPNDTGTSRRAPKDDYNREPQPCVNPKSPERQY